MWEVGQHLWFSPWDSLEPYYCVVLEVDERFIKIRLVDDRELWANDFELSEDLDNG